MLKKSDKTTKFIIETVAPIFSKKGYTATSMADITKATKLTKGAIYGNFENKEAIAIAAFQKNVNELLVRISKFQEQGKSALDKLFLITEFYRNYTAFSKDLGGCPILNVGVDATHQETRLLTEVQHVIQKTQNNIVKLLDRAIAEGSITSEINKEKFAKLMYTRIQGAVFMSQTMDDDSYMVDAADDLDRIINREFKNNIPVGIK